MSDEPSDPEDVLGFLSEERKNRRDPEEHPSPETLTAYQANELSADEDERIQSHLAACKHCTELLLDLDELLKPPVAEPVADFEAAADWRKLREKMELKEKNQAPARPDRRRFFASVWGGYSVAAALLVMTVGFGVRTAQLLEERRRPQPVRTVQTLSAQGSTRGSANPEGEPVALPAEIFLSLPTETPSSLYRVTIIRHGSLKPEWSFDMPQEKGDLTFVLPADSLSPGTYTVQVAPLGQGRPGPAAWSYSLRIVTLAP